MSLNESRTPGRAATATPLRPHYQGGSLSFPGDVQPVVEPAAAQPLFGAITDFVDEQCESVKRLVHSPLERMPVLIRASNPLFST